MPRVANIGPRGIRQRRRFGAVALGIGIVVAVVMIAAGAPPAWRSVLFLPLFLAGLGFFQARDRT
jgi:hypothetical protein